MQGLRHHQIMLGLLLCGVVIVVVVVVVGIVVVVGDVVVVVFVVVSCFSRRHSIRSVVSSSHSLISTSSCVSTLTCSAGVLFVRPEYRVRHPSSISVSWRMLLRYLFCCSLLSEVPSKERGLCHQRYGKNTE